MTKAAILLVVVLAAVWYHLAGPGAPGRSPHGTALAFARAAAAPDCAARMDQQFPNAAGARAACSAELARALRASSQVMVTSNDGFTALVECFYGST